MATNKNQHFVPRCYLKAFTLNGENAAINLLNLDRQRSIFGAPVKNQCSGDYFYGQDDRLENAIRSVENGFATVIARIQSPGYVLTDGDRTMLRTFILFQHVRTEAASRRAVEWFAGMEKAAGSPLPDFKPTIKQAVQSAMSSFAKQLHVIDDLKICLIKNRTAKPFITSDDPAVLTNRWHKDDKRTRHRAFGLMSSGAIMFLPLSPKIQCVAYDGDVYSIPHVGGWTEIRNEIDVASFNEQQFLNAVANVYFRDSSDHDWILDSYRAIEHRRIESRHRVTYAVLDGIHEGGKRYRVVDRFDAEEHQEALMHTETLSPTPSRWPTPLRWRAKGGIYCNGTASGYTRAAHIPLRPQRDYWRESSGY